MNRLISVILVILIMLSCNDIQKPRKPNNLISKDKMVDILADISLLNAAKGINKTLLEEKDINPQNYIYNKYNIDSIQFSESNNYYAYDVKKYEEIYLKVKERLESKKEEIKRLQEIEKKEKDSIREAKKKKRDSIKNLNLNKPRDFKQLQEKVPKKQE